MSDLAVGLHPRLHGKPVWSAIWMGFDEEGHKVWKNPMKMLGMESSAEAILEKANRLFGADPLFANRYQAGRFYPVRIDTCLKVPKISRDLAGKIVLSEDPRFEEGNR